jgi:hypothetical protein
MRGAVRGITPRLSIRMREHAYNLVFVLESGGAHAPYILTIVNTVTQPVEKFLACGPFPRP